MTQSINLLIYLPIYLSLYIQMQMKRDRRLLSYSVWWYTFSQPVRGVKEFLSPSLHRLVITFFFTSYHISSSASSPSSFFFPFLLFSLLFLCPLKNGCYLSHFLSFHLYFILLFIFSLSNLSHNTLSHNYSSFPTTYYYLPTSLPTPFPSSHPIYIPLPPSSLPSFHWYTARLSSPQMVVIREQPIILTGLTIFTFNTTTTTTTPSSPLYPYPSFTHNTNTSTTILSLKLSPSPFLLHLLILIHLLLTTPPPTTLLLFHLYFRQHSFISLSSFIRIYSQH